jgi:transcriptional regulator GlxA family with amidase domain
VRHVAFLVIPPFVELDLFGPMNVFALAGGDRDKLPEPDQRLYRTTLLTAGPDLAVQGECGVTLLAHQRYSELAEPPDTLIVVGGVGALRFAGDPRLCAWLRDISGSTRRTAAICTGSFVLAAAGLLDGRRAATHWSCIAQLTERHPGIEVDSDSIWVKDGPIYTSAGITAGIDLALAMVEEDLGSRVALDIARFLVVFLKRPGGQRQFSVALSAQEPANKTFADLIHWIAANVDKRLDVETLAERMAMSPRNFARVFRDEVGMTPARYVRKARLEAARILLEQTRKGIEEIARLCGFGDDELLRRAFIEDFGVPPAQYRQTFETGPLERR